MSKKSDNKSFSIFPEVFMATEKLSNEQFGELLRAAFCYWADGTEYDFQDPAMSIAFCFVASGLDRRATASEMNTQNAIRRWTKPAAVQSDAVECDSDATISDADAAHSQADAAHTQADAAHTQADAADTQSDAPIQSNPIQSNPIQSIPVQSEPVRSDCEGGTGTQASPARGQKKFMKPTAQEIRAFCAGKRLNIDVEKFLDHYDSVGWMVGRNSMRDWHAAVRNWARRDQELHPPVTEEYYGSGDPTLAFDD